jgi:predicted dehydrogenase
MRHKDQVFVAACDVAADRRDQFVTAAGKMDTCRDYRCILDRKDLGAILITTPDHWHSPTRVAACEAGKDVYIEKPNSNATKPAQRMVEAVRKHKRVCQVGLQQRSGKHFHDCAKMIREGPLGNITHVAMPFTGGYTQPPQSAQAPPDTLDWDGFQGPAPRRPFKPVHLRWREYYDYGGGIVTDWGVHLADVALWYMDADSKVPLLTSAAAQYWQVERGLEQVPDAVMVVWRHDKFVACFTNMNVFPNPRDLPLSGKILHGRRGNTLIVNRAGYEIRPGRAREGEKAIEAVRSLEPPTGGGPRFDRAAAAHVRNFLDCVKPGRNQSAISTWDSTRHCRVSLRCWQSVTANRMLGTARPPSLFRRGLGGINAWQCSMQTSVLGRQPTVPHRSLARPRRSGRSRRFRCLHLTVVIS